MRNILKNKWAFRISRKSSHNVSIDYELSDDTNYSKIKKKLEMFDLGLVLFYSVIGGNEIIDFSQYMCSHHDNKQNLACCCFYHCLEKSENEKLEYKIKLTNLITKSYSSELVSFLCELTSYSLNTNVLTKNKIKNHKWLMNSETKDKEVLLNLEELLKVSNLMSNKPSFIKLEKLCENISIVLPSCKDSLLQILLLFPHLIKFL
jgi:hypothetical protein